MTSVTEGQVLTQNESDRVALAVNGDASQTLTPAQDRQAREEAAFNAVLDHEAVERREKPAQHVGKKAAKKPAETKEQPVAEKAVAAKVEEKPKTQETPAQDKGEDLAYEHAVKALRLDGYETGDLDTLSRERVIALGEKASKRQTAYSQKLEGLTKKVTQGEAAKPNDVEREASQPRQPLDRSAVAKPVADLFGEEAEPVLGAYVDERQAVLRSDLDEARGLLRELATEIVSMKAARMRGKLPEDIRELASDDEFESKVVPRALQMYSGGQGGYDKFEDALRDATLVIAGPRIRGDIAALRAKKSDQRENGQMYSTDSKVPPKAKSWDERAYEAFKVIESGGGADAARSAFGS